MNKHEKEIAKAQLSSEEKTLKELQQVFKKARKDVQEKIAELNSRTDMQNLQSIIYQKKYQQAILGQINEALADLNSGQYKTVEEYLVESYDNGYIGMMYSLQSQGIPMTVPINDRNVVRALTTDSKLSKKYYKADPLKGRLEENVTLLKTRVRSNLSRGIIAGKSWLEVAVDIASGMNNPFDIALKDAMRIARTEGHRVHQQGYLDAGDKAKEKGADILKQWDATMDSKTRPAHQQADGQIVEWDEYFTVGGEKMKAPSVGGSAKNVVNCRCQLLQRARWALDEEELETLQKRAEFFGLDKAESFEDFKQKYLKLPEKADKIVLDNQVEEYTKKQDSLAKDFKRLTDYTWSEVSSLDWNDDLIRITATSEGVSFNELKGLIDELKGNAKKLDSLKEKLSEFAPDIPNPYGFKTIKLEHTFIQDIAKVNPNYSQGTLYQNNCGNCSVAYELLRRGFDVEAKPMNGMYTIDWKKHFKGFEPHHVNATRKASALKEMKEEIASWGEGARGGVFVVWDGRSWGHFFATEVVNGEAVFVDGQNNKSGDYVEDYFSRVKPSSILYGRWDNLEMTDKVTEAVQNRGE